MDPVSLAIITGLTTSAASAALDALRTLLIDKFGSESRVVRAVDDLAEDPNDDAQRLVLQKQVSKVHADQDPDILAAATALIEHIKVRSDGAQKILTVRGSGAAATDYGVAAGAGGLAIGGNVHGGIEYPLHPDKAQ